MRKRILSLLLAVIITFSLLPANAFAVTGLTGGDITDINSGYGVSLTGGGLTIDGTGGDCVCEDGCTEDEYNEGCPVCSVDWSQCVNFIYSGELPEVDPGEIEMMAATATAYNEATLNSAIAGIDNGGTITLTGSFNVANTIVINRSGVSFTINGNGNTITAMDGGTWNNNIMLSISGSSLTLQDITLNAAQKVRVVNVAANTQLTVNSGTTITGGTHNSNGGGVYVGVNGTFTMSGGTISGNKSTNTGGGVYSGGTFTMSGGIITGNSTTGGSLGGGGVYVASGTFTMNGGEISNNTATTSTGGGVFVAGGNFTMNGGTITNNTASGSGGGVCVDSTGNFTIGNTNAVTITGNTVDGNASNVGFKGNYYVTLDAGAPKTGSRIGVSTATAPTSGTAQQFAIRSGTMTENQYAGIFFSDQLSGAKIYLNGNNLYLGGTNGENPYDATALTVAIAAGTGMTVSNSPQTVAIGSALSPAITVTATGNYILPTDESVNNSGGVLYNTGLTFNRTNDTSGTITGIPNKNVNVTLPNGTLNQYNVTISGSNFSLDNGMTPGTPKAFNAGAVTITVTAVAGYTLPESAGTSGGLSYTRDISDPTNATISGTLSGNASFSLTPTYAGAVYVHATKVTTGHDGTFTKPYQTLQAAYNAIANGETREIRVLSDLSSATSIPAFRNNKTVTIVSYSNETTINSANPWTISRGSTDNAAFMTVNSGSNITFKHIILDGGSNESSKGSYFYNEGTLTLDDGAILQNQYVTSVGTVGAIHMVSGVLNITGTAIIRNNRATYNGMGGGVYAQSGVVNISGSSQITGNSVSQNGGGVYVASGIINISGSPKITGNITHNTTQENNIYLATGKTLTINGSLTTDAKIGVYLQAMPTSNNKTVNVATGATSGDEAFFTSDRPTDAGIIFEGGIVKLSYDAREGAPRKDKVLFWSPKTSSTLGFFTTPAMRFYQNIGADVTMAWQQNTEVPLPNLVTNVAVPGSISNYTPLYDLVFVVMPEKDFSSDEIEEMNKYMTTGGRLVLVGENYTNFKEIDDRLSNLAKALGANFNITAGRDATGVSVVNQDSMLGKGLSTVNGTPVAHAAAHIDYSGKAQWVLKTGNTVWCVDQAAGTYQDGNMYGRITAISDLNCILDINDIFNGKPESQWYPMPGAQPFLLRLLENTKANIEAVEKGENPNGTLDPGAKIGSITYSTLQAAIDAALPGQTIELLKNVTTPVTVGKSVIIDGGASKFTAASITVNGDCTVTLQNMNSPDVTLTGGGKAAFNDASVTTPSVTVSSTDSYVIVAGTNSPQVTLNVGSLSNNQQLVQSSNTTPPDASKFTMNPSAKGLYMDASDPTKLRLGDKVTINFPGAPGDGTGSTGDYTFVTNDTDTVFGSQLPDPGVGKVWEDASGNAITAETVIPSTAPIVSLADALKHPIEVTVGSTTCYFDSLDANAVAYTTNGGDIPAVTPATLAGLWSGSGQTVKIEIYSDITVSRPITLPAGQTVELRSNNDGNFTITANSGFTPDTSAIITVPEATTLKVGDANPTFDGATGIPNDDTPDTYKNEVHFRGNGKGTAVIENDGTLKLGAGSIETGSSDTFAIIQNSTSNPIEIDGVGFLIRDRISIKTGTQIKLTRRPINGTTIVLTLQTSATGQEVVTGINGLGPVKITNPGITLNKKDSADTTNSILETISSGTNIVLARESYDGFNGKADQPDGYVYGHPSMDDMLGNHNIYGSVGGYVYVVNNMTIPANTVIPGEVAGEPTKILSADRSVTGEYGTVVTITNKGNPIGDRIITIEDCPVTFSTAENGDPKLAYEASLRDYVNNEILAKGYYTQAQQTAIEAAVVAAVDEISGLAAGATYGDIADAVNDCLKAIAATAVNASVDKDGGGIIAVFPSDPAKDYVLVDSDGNVVATAKNNNDGGQIVFDGLMPGQGYEVVAVPKGTTVPGNGESAGTLSGTRTEVTVPAVNTDAGGNVSAKLNENKDKVTITISPADPSVDYAIIYTTDPGGVTTVVPGCDWKNGEVISFEVNPGTNYEIVTRPATDETTDAATINGKGTDIKTPSASFADVTSGDVSRSEDGTSVTIGDTKMDQEYALVDSNGNIIGWKDGTGGELPFVGLDPNETYKIVTRERDQTPPSSPSDGVTLLPGLGDGGTEDISGGANKITIGSTDSDTWYAVVDANGNIAGGNPDGWQLGTGDSGNVLNFSPLEPGAEYSIITMPKDNNAANPDTKKPALTEPIGGGTAVITGPAPVTGINRESDEENSTSGDEKDKLTFNVRPETSGDIEYEYAIVKKPGDASTAVWFDDSVVNAPASISDGAGNNLNYTLDDTGKVTVTGLDPDSEYQVLIRVKNDDPNTTAIPSVTDIPSISDFTGGVDANDKAYVNIDPAADGKYYAIVDADGNVSGKGNVGSTGWVDGNNAPAKISDLSAGTEYTMVTLTDEEYAELMAKTSQQQKDYLKNKADQNGKTIVTPVTPVESGSISTTSDKITINPSDPSLQYNVVDPDTGAVVGTWKQGNQNNSKVEFDGLTPGKAYEVVTAPSDTNLPAGTTVNDVIIRPGTDAVTKFGSVTGKLTGDGKASITVSPTNTDTKYAVVDKDGKIIGTWQTGDGTSGNTFTGLNPGEEYTVVSVPKANPDDGYPMNPNDLKDEAGVKIAAPKASTLAITNLTAGSDSITIKPIDSNLEYAIYDPDTGKLVTLDGFDTGSDSDPKWKGGKDGGTITFDSLKSGKEYIVVTRPKAPADAERLYDVNSAPTATTGFKDYTGAWTSETNTSITIEPTDGNRYYALINPVTGAVISNSGAGGNTGWHDGGTPGGIGSVTFTGLPKDTMYEVVSVPKSGGIPSEDNVGTDKTGTPVSTPVEPVKTGDVSATGNTITINPTDAACEYALVDSGGNVVTTWKTPATGSEVTFGPLAYDTEYKVVVRKKSVNGETTVYADPSMTAVKTESPTQRCTITYNPDGGTGASNPHNDVAQFDTVILAAAPTKIGSVFVGWNDGSATYAAGSKYTMPGRDVIMTAIWRSVYGISGNVELESGGFPAAPGAEVELHKGGSIYDGKKTASSPIDGTYSFADIPAGDYNIVVKYTDPATNDTVTVTALVSVSADTDATKIIIPARKTNSTVVIDGSSQGGVLNEALVGGLNEQFTSNLDGLELDDNTATAIKNGSLSIELNLKITPKAEHQIPIEAADIGEKAAENNSQVALYFDATVKQIVTDQTNNTTVTVLNTLPQYITIVVPIPEELRGKAAYTVYSVHNGNAEALQYGEKIQEASYIVDAEKTTITIYTKQFSTYALAYSDDAQVPSITGQPTNQSVTIGDSVTLSVTASTTDGGILTYQWYKSDGTLIPDATDASYTFTPNATGTTGYYCVVTNTNPNATGVLTATKTSDTITVTVNNRSSGNISGGGGSGGSAASNTVIKKYGVGNGTVTTNPINPVSGNKVIITIKPDAGYTLDKLIITDANGNVVSYTANGDGTYTYTQPTSKVTIAVTFKKSADISTDSDVSKMLNTKDHMAYVSGTGGNLFEPDKSMTRAEVAQMLYNLLLDKNVTLTKSFTDIPEDMWYAKAVQTLASLDIIAGYPDGSSRPNDNITRAEFATLAVKFGRVSPGEKRFDDVPSTHWAYDYINTAVSFGWVTGVGDGEFDPDRDITRAEAVTLMNRVLGRFPDKVYIDSHFDLIRFSDVASSHWAFYNIIEAANTHDYSKTGETETWKDTASVNIDKKHEDEDVTIQGAQDDEPEEDVEE